VPRFGPAPAGARRTGPQLLVHLTERLHNRSMSGTPERGKRGGALPRSPAQRIPISMSGRAMDVGCPEDGPDHQKQAEPLRPRLAEARCTTSSTCPARCHPPSLATGIAHRESRPNRLLLRRASPRLRQWLRDLRPPAVILIGGSGREGNRCRPGPSRLIDQGDAVLVCADRRRTAPASPRNQPAALPARVRLAPSVRPISPSRSRRNERSGPPEEDAHVSRG